MKKSRRIYNLLFIILSFQTLINQNKEPELDNAPTPEQEPLKTPLKQVLKQVKTLRRKKILLRKTLMPKDLWRKEVLTEEKKNTKIEKRDKSEENTQETV